MPTVGIEDSDNPRRRFRRRFRLRWPALAALARLARLVARIPATIHVKLLMAFLAMALLLLAAGAVGLRAVQEANERTEAVVQSQRKIAAYRQLNHDTIGQLYNAAVALLQADPPALEVTMRQLQQFGYDLDRLQFIAQDELDIMTRVRSDYEEFIKIVTRSLEMIHAGQADQGRDLQVTQARPLAERLERLTNALVNKAESAMVIGIEQSHAASLRSQRIIVGFAVGSIVLALLLGYAISWSITEPVRQTTQRLSEIAAGDFTKQIAVGNRDELGELAVKVNEMSDRLGHLYNQLEARSSEIESKSRLLEIANRHKSEFLATMSHELRTPLNAIIGFSEVLQERLFGELNAKQREYVQDIRASGYHLLSLINDVLDLAKVEAGRMDLHITQFDVPEAVNNTVMLVRERALRLGIDMDVQFDRSLASITGDERRFKQIMLNLLSNAVKFTPAGGRITISAKAIAPGVEVSVRDTGIGIAREDQQSVFEPFQQVTHNAGVKRDGTGLGLALAKQFVEMHGGRLWLESEPGRGSTFTFTLAAQPCPAN